MRNDVVDNIEPEKRKEKKRKKNFNIQNWLRQRNKLLLYLVLAMHYLWADDAAIKLHFFFHFNSGRHLLQLSRRHITFAILNVQKAFAHE